MYMLFLHLNSNEINSWKNQVFYWVRSLHSKQNKTKAVKRGK